MPTRLLIVGIFDAIHLGAHIKNAAESLGHIVDTCDATRAYEGTPLVRRFHWWVRGHYPPKLKTFSEEVVEHATAFRPNVVLCLGLAPVNASALRKLKELNASTAVYVSDDPWNKTHEAKWFFKSLLQYDFVFTPRYANYADFLNLGCENVGYVPFAYDPDVHFKEKVLTSEEKARFECDVLFAGGADPDRIPYVEALISAGIKVKLFGGYWDRYPATRPFWGGHLSLPELRKATLSAKATLCLVRRANRDAHAMRSFEAPAMGGCLLAESTADHRRFLGDDGAQYFSGTEDLVAKAKQLLANPDKQRQLREAAHRQITERKNTYADRVTDILTQIRNPAGLSSTKPQSTGSVLSQ